MRFPSRPLIDKGPAGGRSPDTVDPRIMADIVKGADVRMGEGGNRPRLSLEPLT